MLALQSVGWLHKKTEKRKIIQKVCNQENLDVIFMDNFRLCGHYF